MSEENFEEFNQESEIDSLKLIATNMGLDFHPSIGVEKLKAKIAKAKEPVASKQVAKINQMDARKEKINKAKKLVRVRISNMNPTRRESKGEYFSVSNAVVGTVKRFVPFDVEWHVEDILYKTIKNRRFRKTIEEPDGKGGKISKNIFLPEFSVELLPALTTQELKDLAADQSARGAIDN
jgi:hypothetical protein